MDDALGTAGEVLGLLISFTILIGIAARFVLLPWLRDQLGPTIRKVNESHRQLTVNGHKSKEPTVLDKLDQMSREFRSFKEESRDDRADIRQSVEVMGQMFDGHLDWSAQEVHTIWDHLKRHRHDGTNHVHTAMKRDTNTQQRRQEDGAEQHGQHPQRD